MPALFAQTTYQDWARFVEFFHKKLSGYPLARCYQGFKGLPVRAMILWMVEHELAIRDHPPGVKGKSQDTFRLNAAKSTTEILHVLEAKYTPADVVEQQRTAAQEQALEEAEQELHLTDLEHIKGKVERNEFKASDVLTGIWNIALRKSEKAEVILKAYSYLGQYYGLFEGQPEGSVTKFNFILPDGSSTENVIDLFKKKAEALRAGGAEGAPTPAEIVPTPSPVTP